MSNRWITTVLSLILLAGPAAVASPAQVNTPKKVSAPTAVGTPHIAPFSDEFPIIGVGARKYYDSKSSDLQEYSYLDDEMLRLFRDAGINIVQSCLSIDRNVKAPAGAEDFSDRVVMDDLVNFRISLLNCNRNSMKMLMRLFPFSVKKTETGLDRATLNRFKVYSSNMQLLVENFSSDMAVAGWMLWDEPNAAIFRQLGGVADLVRDSDPWKRMVYSNLLPSSAGIAGFMAPSYKAQGTALPDVLAAYREYVGQYVAACNPQVISYDFYPFRKAFQAKTDASGNPVLDNGFGVPVSDNYTVRFEPLFFILLDQYHDMSKQYGIPFWMYACTLETQFKGVIKDGNSYRYSVLSAPTLTQLQFQIRHALAYGAQGVNYWSLWLRNSNSDERYLNAPLKPVRGSNKMDTSNGLMNDIAKVNAEIQKFRNVFLGCDVRYCAPTSVSGYYLGDMKPFNFSRGESLVKSVKCTAANGDAKGVMLSMIRNGGKDYVVAVNMDFDKAQNVEIAFKGKMAVEDGSNTAGKAIKSVKTTLEPAGWVIFRKL